MAVRMVVLLSLTTLANEREENFLKEHGFGQLVNKFKEQEVTMDMMSSLSNADCDQLWPLQAGRQGAQVHCTALCCTALHCTALHFVTLVILQVG